jgi:hypothetical protein
VCKMQKNKHWQVRQSEQNQNGKDRIMSEQRRSIKEVIVELKQVYIYVSLFIFVATCLMLVPGFDYPENQKDPMTWLWVCALTWLLASILVSAAITIGDYFRKPEENGGT